MSYSVSSKILTIFLCAFVFAIGVFRTPEVGVDTKRYLAAMDRYHNLDQISLYGEEPGFEFLSVLSNGFGAWSDNIFLIITWSIFFLLSARYMFVGSNTRIYGVLLFIAMIIPILGLTQIMYGVASAILATSLIFLTSNRYFFAILSFVAAVLMHYSFIFFTFILLTCYILRDRSVICVTFFCGVLLMLWQILPQTRYNYLIGGSEVSVVKLAMGFLVALTFINRSTSNFDKTLRNFQLVGLLLLLATFFSNGALLNRAYTVFFFLHLPKINDTINTFKYRNVVFFNAVIISVSILMGGLYFVKVI